MFVGGGGRWGSFLLGSKRNTMGTSSPWVVFLSHVEQGPPKNTTHISPS